MPKCPVCGAELDNKKGGDAKYKRIFTEEEIKRRERFLRKIGIISTILLTAIVLWALAQPIPKNRCALLIIYIASWGCVGWTWWFLLFEILDSEDEKEEENLNA